MFKLIKAIMPRSDNFFDLFEAQAGKAQEAAQTLRAILDGGPDTVDKCTRLSTPQLHHALRPLRHQGAVHRD